MIQNVVLVYSGRVYLRILLHYTRSIVAYWNCLNQIYVYDISDTKLDIRQVKRVWQVLKCY